MGRVGFSNKPHVQGDSSHDYGSGNDDCDEAGKHQRGENPVFPEFSPTRSGSRSEANTAVCPRPDASVAEAKRPHRGLPKEGEGGNADKITRGGNPVVFHRFHPFMRRSQAKAISAKAKCINISSSSGLGDCGPNASRGVSRMGLRLQNAKAEALVLCWKSKTKYMAGAAGLETVVVHVLGPAAGFRNRRNEHKSRGRGRLRTIEILVS
jgi:hypothetical protein